MAITYIFGFGFFSAFAVIWQSIPFAYRHEAIAVFFFIPPNETSDRKIHNNHNVVLHLASFSTQHSKLVVDEKQILPFYMRWAAEEELLVREYLLGELMVFLE